MPANKDAGLVDGPFQMHPGYGLSDEYRLQILRHAEDVGVAAAARDYRVGKTAIYSWRKRLRDAEV